MLTTFTSFEALIDALGGVTVDVPKNVTVPDPMTAENVSLKAGRSQSLDGSEADVYKRQGHWESEREATHSSRPPFCGGCVSTRVRSQRAMQVF